MDEAVCDFLRDSCCRLPVGWRLRWDPSVSGVIIRRAARRLCGLDYDGCEKVAALWRAGRGKTGLKSGVVCELTEGYFFFLTAPPPRGEAPFPLEGTCALDGVGEIASAPSPAVVSDDLLCPVLDRESLKGAILRTRRNGDRIKPLGMDQSKKLSDYLTDRHVPRPMRDTLMLLARGRDILYAAGVGVSQDARLKAGSEGVRLTARYYISRWEGNSCSSTKTSKRS